EDGLWELMRFKWDSFAAVEKRWKELKLADYRLNFLVWSERLKKPKEMSFHFETACPRGDFVSKKVQGVSAFSPYSALGACPHCNGYGANLVYDEKKLIDKELTIEEGGL